MVSRGQIKQVRRDVEQALAGDRSGHGIDHIERVHRLAMSFVDQLPQANKDIVELAAILHDVDDYKLVGKEAAERLENATEIMSNAGIDEAVQTRVKEIISSMGYSKSLRGVRPRSLEGKIVSDADMCDAIGANGIVRALVYEVSDKGGGNIFNRTIWPNVEIAAHQYNSNGNHHDTDGFINHHFEKLLKLKGMMMTEPGKQEALVRDEMMVLFLRQFFLSMAHQSGVYSWRTT